MSFDEELRIRATSQIAAIEGMYSLLEARALPDAAAEFNTLCILTIDRLTSRFDVINRQALREAQWDELDSMDLARILFGMTQALKASINEGWFTSIEEKLNSRMLGNLLDMAEYSMDRQQLGPARVVVSAALEAQLRLMGLKYGVEGRYEDEHGVVQWRTFYQLNEELAQVAYGQPEYLAVSRWLKVHAKAMVPKPGRQNTIQLSEAIREIREFISQFPA